MAGGRPKKYKNAEDMQTKINKYFDRCDEEELPYTIEGLSYALDLDRKSIINYSKDKEFFHTIKRAKAKVLFRLQELALAGKTNASVTIFNLKNNYDYSDKQEIKQDITADVTQKVVWE